MQQEDRAWENRLRYTILANKEEKNYQIPFSDFLDAQGNKVDITNIKTIVFSIIGDYTNYKPFKISVNELAFKTNAVLSVDNFSNTENNKLKNYPNPFANSTTIKLPYSSKSVQIQVFDYLGRVVDFQKINVKGNNNTLKYNEPQLNKGIYKYLVKDDQNKTHSGTFIIN